LSSKKDKNESLTKVIDFIIKENANRFMILKMDKNYFLQGEASDPSPKVLLWVKKRVLGEGGEPKRA
jgi:hypothetical protein